MAEKLLHVLMHGLPMATLVMRGNRLTFTYEESWLSRPDTFALSLSLPLVAREHPDKVIAPYLWNLLPDNHETLVGWAKLFGLKGVNAFSLLQHTGEDVAGAAQFMRPERLDVVQGSSAGQLQWIDETEIARRLRAIHVNRAAWSQPGDAGYFSLSGAQPKMSLLYQDGRWGIPSARTPTTHILKPPGRDFDGFAENEHFCLTLAGAAGLPVANTSVQFFEDQPAFVTERFDREHVDGGLVRVPAEDFCQALGVHPDSKYQNRGGPTPEAILKLLARESSSPEQDCLTFLDALIFNALIGGSDAHAKNYTLLHGGGRVRLAPLYDIASALPYFDAKALKLAMKIGRHYELTSITARDWDHIGEFAGAGSQTRHRVSEMADRLTALVPIIAAQLQDQGLTHKVLTDLQHKITHQIGEARMMLKAAQDAASGGG